MACLLGDCRVPLVMLDGQPADGLTDQGAKRAWPAGGEIDILEGVNNVAGNTYTLHTTNGCQVTNNAQSSSLFLTGDCQYQPGCSFKDKVDNSFGPVSSIVGYR